MLNNFKKRQYIFLWALVVGLLIIVAVLSFFLINDDHSTVHLKNPEKKQLSTGVSRINPQEIWVHNFSAEAKLTQKRLETIEQSLDKLFQFNANEISKSNQTQTPANPFGDLRQDLAVTWQDTIANPNPKGSLLPIPQTNEHLEKTFAETQPFRSQSLQKISLNLHNSRHDRSLKTVDNTIPAGAFAEGILLGGVDASTSIQASNDPRPILIRLTNAGTLPRRFRSDLKGCHVLAASYGDLSSERVFMRLEKLTCIERKTGEVVEINVQGYVAGEDGRAGLRGHLVDRSTESVRNAMVGGFFSSVGHFLGQPRTPLLFAPNTGLAQTNPLTTADILKQSAGNGMSGALEKYADFYIKRAEQMQPVIQVAAGRRADIVFTEGTPFSDSAHRKAVSHHNDQKRFQQVQSIGERESSKEWSSSLEGGR